jgi:twitching motility two-component system response regulator PilH
MGRFGLSALFRRDQSSPRQRRGERRYNQRTIPPTGSTVLVVDDSKTVRFTLSRMLEEGRFGVVQADNGLTAIEKAVQHQPELIIMDIVMPGLNGFRATRQLRKDERTKDIPIIMISGNDEAIEEFWMRKIGADAFLAKPFTRGGLYQAVESILYQNQITAG